VKEKITVLIADDNQEFSRTLATYLRNQEDMEVIGIAKDGLEAVDLIKEKLPDVAILDVIMPHLDGLGVLEKVNNSSSELDKKPICIMLSAVGQDKITQRAISLGAEYYMVKPFDIELLMQRIREIKNFKPRGTRNNFVLREIKRTPYVNVNSDKAEDNQELAYKLNCEAPKQLASAAQANGAAMIQVSTDYVFDGTAHTPYTEDCDPCPDSVYGTTKLEGEKEVMNHCEQAVVIRTAWLYSIFGNNFVKTMLRLGKERDSLGVVFDQIGTPTYANDLARAIYAIINKGIVRGIYHFSNEGVCSWYDFTVAIHRLAGITTCKVKPLHTAEYPAKANRPAYSVLDKTKIKTTFDIEIPHWEESLKQCLIKLGMKNEE